MLEATIHKNHFAITSQAPSNNGSLTISKPGKATTISPAPRVLTTVLITDEVRYHYCVLRPYPNKTGYYGGPLNFVQATNGFVLPVLPPRLNNTSNRSYSTTPQKRKGFPASCRSATTIKSSVLYESQVDNQINKLI